MTTTVRAIDRLSKVGNTRRHHLLRMRFQTTNTLRNPCGPSQGWAGLVRCNWELYYILRGPIRRQKFRSKCTGRSLK